MLFHVFLALKRLKLYNYIILYSYIMLYLIRLYGKVHARSCRPEVKGIMRHVWVNYEQHAFGKDELRRLILDSNRT